MILYLTRFDIDADGCLGHLHNEDRSFELATIERVYEDKPGDESPYSYEPKLQPGTYKCVRGLHRLKANSPEFETFEITGVAGHWGILFHSGNYQKDSDGCVLVGAGHQADSLGLRYVYGSRTAFKALMSHLQGLNEFTLEVTNP